MTSATSPEVALYDTEGSFTKKLSLTAFKSALKYIDFSADSNYLLCEDLRGEVYPFEISTQRHILAEGLDLKVEWLGEGLRSYP